MLNVAGSPPDPAKVIQAPALKGTTVLIGGNLNFLSEATFAELRELHARLRDIGKAVDESRQMIEALVVGAVTATGGAASEGGGGK